MIGFFFFVYLNCNELASHSSKIYTLHFDWEKNTPFIPIMIIPYFSVYLLSLPLIFFMDGQKIHQFAKTVGLSILIAGIIFFLFPTTCELERPAGNYPFSAAFRALHGYDKPHNLFPSLHITLSTIFVLMMWEKRANPWFKAVLVAWLFLICLSVLFTHQHYVPDILGGFVLSGFCYWSFSKSRAPS